MKTTYFCSIATTGPGDLVSFRDAAITYAASRRCGQNLFVEASEAARDLLSWLGIEAVPAAPQGLTYLDPNRPAPDGVQVRALAPWGPSDLSLESYRQGGYVAEAMFAALIRSSYGPDSSEFFPTRSELGFYFEDSLLRESARWDEDYLRDCQAFFMEELMPVELLSKSIALLPTAQRDNLGELCRRWQTELHGVTFLVASQLETLLPLARLLSGLLGTESPAPGLKDLVNGVQVWDQAGWSAAWGVLAVDQRQVLAEALCPEFSDQAEAILFTAGPDLLLWRAAAVAEALR
jgi:hypothetical protein